MLAQSLKSADELDITEPQKEALMNCTMIEHDCGTVCCIKGTAELISGVSLIMGRNPALNELFYT